MTDSKWRCPRCLIEFLAPWNYIAVLCPCAARERERVLSWSTSPEPDPPPTPCVRVA